jgi:hypothetical protein
MPATEIVPADSDYSGSVAEMRRRLPVLAAEGDVEGLLDIACDAGPASILLRKRGYDEQANEMMRLKLEAEAELGALEEMGNSLPAVSGDERHRRKSLAVAKDRGVLGSIMDSADGDLTVGFVFESIRRHGYYCVPVSTTKSALEAWARSRGVKWALGNNGRPIRPGTITPSSLAAEFGIHHQTLRAALGRTGSERVQWRNAKHIAKAIGVDPTSWPPAPSARSRKKTWSRRRWLVREQKPTGGHWDLCYGHFRKCLKQFEALAPNMDPRWDETYEHLYALNAVIEKQMRKPMELPPRSGSEKAASNGTHR